MVTFPPNARSGEVAYERAILDAISAGDVSVSWAPVTAKNAAHEGKFWITALPLKIGGIYPGMGARVLQRAGDLLQATLLTATLLDLAYIQAATRVDPVTSGLTNAMYAACNPLGGTVTDPDMESLACFKTCAKTLDEVLAKANYTQGTLAQSVGKPFILRKGISATVGCNFGWHVRGPGPPYAVTLPAAQPFPFHVIQDPGFAHGLNQNDYASTGQLVSRYCEIDGAPADFYDVIQSAELAPLVSDEGALPFARQPGVDVYACVLGSGKGPKTQAAAADEVCPPPTSPPSNEGSSRGFPWLPVGLITAGVAGAYFTRKSWLPTVRRFIR